MAASGRTEVASDVKFGAGASFIERSLWSKFGETIIALIRCSSADAVTMTATPATTTEYAAYHNNTFANSVRLGR